MSKSVIISCAVTGGIHTPSMSPHLPITPLQIAEQVRKIRGLVESLSLSLATATESRQRLGLKGRKNVGF